MENGCQARNDGEIGILKLRAKVLMAIYSIFLC